MTDKELIARLRSNIFGTGTPMLAADRIEALTKERDQHWNSFVHWRKQADDLTGQLAAARDDAKEAEAYAEELEKELNTCRMAQAVMDNTVADLEAKLAKAVELISEKPILGTYEDHVQWRKATLAEIKGESHD